MAASKPSPGDNTHTSSAKQAANTGASHVTGKSGVSTAKTGASSASGKASAVVASSGSGKSAKTTAKTGVSSTVGKTGAPSDSSKAPVSSAGSTTSRAGVSSGSNKASASSASSAKATGAKSVATSANTNAPTPSMSATGAKSKPASAIGDSIASGRSAKTTAHTGASSVLRKAGASSGSSKASASSASSAKATGAKSSVTGIAAHHTSSTKIATKPSASTVSGLNANARTVSKKTNSTNANIHAKKTTLSTAARASHTNPPSREIRQTQSSIRQRDTQHERHSGTKVNDHRQQVNTHKAQSQNRGIRLGRDNTVRDITSHRSPKNPNIGSSSVTGNRFETLSKKRDATVDASNSPANKNRYNRTYSAGGVSGKGNYRTGGNEGGELKFKQDKRFDRRTDSHSSNFSRSNRTDHYAKSGGVRSSAGGNNRRGTGKAPYEKNNGGFGGNRNRNNGPSGTLLKKGSISPKFGGRRSDEIKNNRPWNRFDTNRDSDGRGENFRDRGHRWGDSRGDRDNAFSSDKLREGRFFRRKSSLGNTAPGTTGDMPYGEQRQSQSDWYKNREQEVKHDRDRYESNDFDKEIEMPLSSAAHKHIPIANPIPKSISITEAISVSDLAKKLNIKGVDLVSKLVSLGIMASINNVLDSDTATLIAEEYGAKVNIISLYDETKLVQPVSDDCKPQRRPPVVTVMGHVDHGKTTLLDTIRKSNVVAGESGGITQHIAAYQIDNKGEKITFIDTPGHAAFTMMRARGAQITDIVVLVVSADDGIMPQTKEAIDHARAAKVPIIVAINKIDLENSNIEQTKKQLSEVGLVAEEWGGEVIMCPVSALKGDGISELLEAILVASHEMDCTALVDKAAVGRILESRIDQGRGIVCSVLIQEGALNIGDFFLAGTNTGKVRSIFDDRGNKLSAAYPSAPVEIIGFSELPNAGDPFEVAADEREAKSISSKRKELSKVELAREMKPLDVEGVYHTIEQQQYKVSKVIVKGDVDGSVEAIKASLNNLQNDQVRLEVIHTAAGDVNENDVLLARASNAMIICFNIKPSARIQKFADHEEIEIRKYNVIYNMIDDMKRYISGMRESEYEEIEIGGCEVRAIFSSSKNEHIIGAYVNKGKVKINAPVEVVRKDESLFKSTIVSLKRFKKNVSSVETGYECGIVLDNDTTMQEGDIIKIFESVLVEQSADSE